MPEAAGPTTTSTSSPAATSTSASGSAPPSTPAPGGPPPSLGPTSPTAPTATPGRGGPSTTAPSPAPPATAAPPPPPAVDLPSGNGAFGRSDAVAVRHGVGVAADGAPLLATNPQLLAGQLDLAETALHDPASPTDRLDLMAHLQQLVYRRLALRPDWEAAFFAALPPRWHDVARRHLTARRHFVAPDVESVYDLPAWTIAAPAPAEQLFAAYTEAGAAYGVPWTVLAAMNLVESAMGRIQGPSSEGNVGPMQFDAAGWAAYGLGGDVWNPRDAIFGAANFLAANGYGAGPAEALFRLRGDWRYVAGVQAYADLLQGDVAQFGAVWRWQVYYANQLGDIWLPVGYSTATRIPTGEYLAQHPLANP